MKKATVHGIIKGTLILFALFILFFAIYSFYRAKQLEQEILDYNTHIQTLTPISTQYLENKISNNDTFFLFTGRETCAYCRKLIPRLGEVLSDPIVNEYLSDNCLEFLYLDSEDTETNLDIKDFREKYNIQYVPSILFFAQDGYHSLDLDVKNGDFTINALRSSILNAPK